MARNQNILLIEKAGGIATVTLNRPDKLNALSKALSAAIGQAFLDLQADRETRVIILTGAGRAFCAGVDLRELGAGRIDVSGVRREGEAHWAEAMAMFEGPVIGAINGVAVTGGMELAMGCDIRIASQEARFADTHARVGVIPGGRMSSLLPRLIGLNRAIEMSLTGNYIDAETAERWGLVNRVVPAAELMPACRRIAGDMLSIDPDFLKTYRRLILAGFNLPFGEADALEKRVQREVNSRLNPADVEQRREAVRQRGRSQQTP